MIKYTNYAHCLKLNIRLKCSFPWFYQKATLLYLLPSGNKKPTSYFAHDLWVCSSWFGLIFSLKICTQVGFPYFQSNGFGVGEQGLSHQHQFGNEIPLGNWIEHFIIYILSWLDDKKYGLVRSIPCFHKPDVFCGSRDDKLIENFDFDLSFPFF